MLTDLVSERIATIKWLLLIGLKERVGTLDESKLRETGQTSAGNEYAAGHSENLARDRRGTDESDENRVATGDPASTRGLLEKRITRTLAGWWLPVYAFVLGIISVGLAPDTGLWWLVPLFGLTALVALAAINRPGGREKERELVGAIHRHGELTPAEAALRTSLTVDEAAKMLEGLTRKGHLQPQTEGSAVGYALRGRDRAGLAPRAPSSVGWEPTDEDAPQALDDPLSGREMEVLKLLSLGRTNPEIASDLFIGVGTVKTHVNNIYRKFGVRNRTEALARATRRESGPTLLLTPTPT